MTIIPLAFALVVTGVAQLGSATGDGAAHLGRRLPVVLIGLLLLPAIITAVLAPLMVTLMVAGMGGVTLTPGQIVPAVPLAVLSSLMILGLPGAISIYASAAPTVTALGAPAELLPILIAVEVIPDMAAPSPM